MVFLKKKQPTRTLDEGLVNERKFLAHSLDADRVLTLVRHYCVPHPQYPRGRVNSIYFDTSHLSAYKEKIEGDTLKRKYRLRWYDIERQKPGPQTVFLEIKYRYGSARDKARYPLKADADWLRRTPLNDPALVALLRRYAPSCADNIPLTMQPALCIAYDRHRYVCPRTGLTVCVDSDIQATRVNPDMLQAWAPFSLNVVVCECKGYGFPEIPWATSLYHAGFRIRSFSKYGECVNQALYGGAPTVMRMSL